MVSSAYCDQTNNEKVPPPVKVINTKMEFNRVNCLVWVLHESTKSFSHTVESFELARSGPELAMAWVVLRPGVPGDPRSCQMDERTISTYIDS